MKRLVARAGLGLLIVLAVAAALVWSRPDLRAALSRRLRPTADAGVKCAEHGIPESLCTLCRPELETSLAICREHGDLPEVLCTLCHPESAASFGLELCAKGHGLPESYCQACRDEAIPTIDDGWCSIHGQPQARCPEGQASNSDDGSCQSQLPVIRLARPETARRIGLETAKARLVTRADALEGNAEVAYDANNYAEVRPRVAGLIRQILADEGSQLARGDPLATIDSAEVGSAKAAYLAALPLVELAQATLERTQQLARANALPMKDELEARANLNRAQADLLDAAQRLRNLGLNDADLAAIAQSKDTSTILTIRSPIAGTIVQRHAVLGEAVDASHTLFVVADIRAMWTWIDVYENEIERVEQGQPIEFTLAGAQGAVFQGHVDWIDTAVNPVTRTIRVRGVLENPAGRLRANQFGRARIRLGEPRPVLLIPRQALQEVGRTSMVFLPQPDGSYHPQRVIALLPEDDPEHAEITWGLQDGQTVVTVGSFLLKSELLEHEIGAALAEH